MWSSRFGSSGLWPYRQRCEQGLPIPRTHPFCSCLPFSMTCLPLYPPPQEQYRFLYHTVSQMFLSAIQNASPHYQNLKEVPRPPSNPQRPGPRGLWPPLWQHLALGLLPVARTDSDIYLCHPPCFLIRVSPLKLPPQRPQ